MPAGKRRQSNAMLYTLIIFVGLFVVATTAAVIYYVKAEELRTQAAERQDEMNRLVSQEELRNIGTIVGTRLPGESGLGTVITHLDQMVELIKGGPVRVTSPEVKVAEVGQALEPLLARARAYVSLPSAPPAAEPNAARGAARNQPADPNATAGPQVALTSLISDLLTKLDKTTQEKVASDEQLSTLRARFDDAIQEMEATKQKLTNDVKGYEEQVNQIKANYDKLIALSDQKTQEQLGVIRGDLEKARADTKQLNDNLLKTQAELNVAQGRLQGALAQVNEIKPPPDNEAPAFQADGHVILVDQTEGVIHINLGLDDHVYQGLTFSVYDRSAGIPRDGKPKAEVEVFAIDQKVSTARVLSADRRNPIAQGDLVANLIWDSNRENQFVVAGEFDIDGNGQPDLDGKNRIEALIRKWGGVISQVVTARTDFVILGEEPKVPPEPTPEILTTDPTAQEKYDVAQQKDALYNQIRRQAEALWVPVFNYDRFLYFTGYANQTDRPGAL